MVNDLKDLMRQNVAAPPPDHLDLDALVESGRRRVRTRRVRTGVAAVAAVGVVAVGGSLLPSGTPPEQSAATRPRPEAPTITLADATAGVEGRDFRVIRSITNENLNADDGQYLDGVTDDGKILFRDGPSTAQESPRLALMDPDTGDKDWLPAIPGLGWAQTWPVELGSDRLVILSSSDGSQKNMVAYVFDRAAREWSTMSWTGLPKVDFPRVVAGPDDRLYFFAPAKQGGPPPGGWPTGPDGEADDADAPGDTFHLWSASLTDPADARDEGLTVGAVDFTDTAMVWTDGENGDAGQVHVRDLATGEEHAFDPQTGEKCNLLGFAAAGDRIMMSQYCGTYPTGRDDRVQIMSSDGDQVVTIQGDGIDGWIAGQSTDLVNVTSFEHGRAGTYVYDLSTDRFVRVSEDVGSWGSGGIAPGEQFLWSTPVNGRRGETQHVGELLD